MWRQRLTEDDIPIGTAFGRWRTTSAPYVSSVNGKTFTVIDLICECGTAGTKRTSNLRWGMSKSCGCNVRTHGLSKHPLYAVWNSMIRRCHHPQYRLYADYGGRGIKVCDRWRGPDGVQNFISDMGPRPEGMSVERINNNGDYEPANCRWATSAEQNRNQRARVTNAAMDLILAENEGLRARAVGYERALLLACAHFLAKNLK